MLTVDSLWRARHRLAQFGKKRTGSPQAVARKLSQLLGKVLEPWIELKLEPEDPAAFDDGRPVCYVLEDYGLSNALILDRACEEAGLPSPLTPLAGDPLGRKRAYVALSRRNAGGALALAYAASMLSYEASISAATSHQRRSCGIRPAAGG